MKIRIIVIAILLGIIFLLLFRVQALQPLVKYIDYDCVNFKTQAEAQKVFEKNPKDIYGLDADHDGIACEILP